MLRSDVNNMCTWATEWKTRHREVRFYDEMANIYDLGSSSEIIVSSVDFNGHVGKCANSFKGVDGGNDIWKRRAEGRKLLECCDKKEL